MVRRDREAADAQLFEDYLSPNPAYDKETIQEKISVSKTSPIDNLLLLFSLERVACKIWILWIPFDVLWCVCGQLDFGDRG